MAPTPTSCLGAIPPHLIPSKNTTIIILAAAATAVPVAYIVAFRQHRLRRARICPGKPPALPASMPEDVRKGWADDDESGDVVLSHQRLISTPVAVSSLLADLQVEEEGLDVILTPYVRATMASWLESVWGFLGGKEVQKVVEQLGEVAGAEELVRSLSPAHISNVEFDDGDLVHGIYRVTHRGESADGGERVEFTIAPPLALLELHKGLDINGIVVAGWEVLEPESGKEEEEQGVNLVFVHETWMWRWKGEQKTLLENPLGRWWHSGLVGWMIGKGIDAVTLPAAGVKPGALDQKPVPDPAVAGAVLEKQPLKEEKENETETETETETSASEEEE